MIFIFTSCQPEAQLPPPNILWITNEDTGPAWGCYGDTYATTPHIDQLATNGYIFTQAFSNAPICAPARSTLITGIYATSLGTQHLRSDIPVPQDLKILPELLKEAGYYTTNNAKTDYNFSPKGRWDENGRDAHWRNRPAETPFFSVFNFGITHEGHTNRLDLSDTEGLREKHDPQEAKLPPYFPDTPKFREIWAHMNDLMTVFDQEVGNLVSQLKEDGLYDNTIIFVFSDHGYGLPRYKRWLYYSGMHVPFVLHVPDQYRHLVKNPPGQRVDQMVSFVDMAPTVLQLAGVEVPERMEGMSFLGENAVKREYVYDNRSRADDCYDVARSVYDGRYMYIRHFMPQKSYIQDAVIFKRGKGSYDELYRVRAEGSLPPEAKDMFEPKPVEELYDLQADPYELKNLVSTESGKGIAEKLREKVYTWMREHHDTGLLNEGEMMLRAEAAGSVYEMARDTGQFQVERILEAASEVGKVEDPGELTELLQDEDAAVRYWALVALEGDLSPVQADLRSLLDDPSPSVAIMAAELLVRHHDDPVALRTLEAYLQHEVEPVVLQAAIAVRNTGVSAKPLLSTIQNDIMPHYSGEVWGRYKNWSYPMFIGMALDQTQRNCGVEISYE